MTEPATGTTIISSANYQKGGDPMSHGASPVVAALFGLAALLTAGVANANCTPSHSASASPPAADGKTATGTQTPATTRG